MRRRGGPNSFSQDEMFRQFDKMVKEMDEVMRQMNIPSQDFPSERHEKYDGELLTIFTK